MKHDKMIASWDKILPDEAADARMRSNIMAYQREHTKKGKVISMTRAMKLIVPIAACFALAVTGTAYLGARNHWFGTRGSADSNTPAGGVNEAGCYAVACFPADRSEEEVAKSNVRAVTAEDAANIAGLCDYLPASLPDGYEWETAGLYETEMKDGTVYRMLKITYSNAPGAYTEKDGSAVLTSGDLGGNFFFSVSDFQPGVHETIPADSVSASALSDKWEDGVFCIGYGDYCVTLEPTSLSQAETLSLIQSIGK